MHNSEQFHYKHFLEKKREKEKGKERNVKSNMNAIQIMHKTIY